MNTITVTIQTLNRLTAFLFNLAQPFAKGRKRHAQPTHGARVIAMAVLLTCLGTSNGFGQGTPGLVFTLINGDTQYSVTGYTGTAVSVICFTGLDFGVETPSFDLKYSYNNPAQNLKIWLKLRNEDNTKVVIGQIIPESTTSNEAYITKPFTLNEALIGSGLTGLKNLVISIEGGQDAIIDWIKLTGAPGVYSNITEFRGIENGSTVMDRMLYEHEANEIPDSDLPNIGSPVISPANKIIHKIE